MSREIKLTDYSNAFILGWFMILITFLLFGGDPSIVDSLRVIAAHAAGAKG